MLRAWRGEVRLVEAQPRDRLNETRRIDRLAGEWLDVRGSPRAFPRRPASSFATMARSASRAARRISAPAPTRFSRSLTSQKTGVPLDKIEVVLGDTSLPAGPISGGSMVTGSVIPAVFAAADKCDRIADENRDDNARLAV